MIRRSILLCLMFVCGSQPVHGFVAPGKMAQPSTVTARSVEYYSLRSSRTSRAKSSSKLCMSTQAYNPTKAASTRTAGRKRMASCMAFLAGWANIAIFTKFKTFATMLTGNTMWLAMSITERKYADVAYYLSVIFSYNLGTAAFRRTDLSFRKQTLPVCAAVVASLFILGDWVHFATMTRWIPMMLFATAFGVINSLGTEVSGTLTFVVTGHTTRLVNQLVDRGSRTAGRKKLTEAQKTAMVLNSAICCGFFSGCVFATLLMSFGFLNRFGVFSAIGLSHAGLWLAHDMEALGGAWWLRKDNEMCDLDDDGKPCEIEDQSEPPVSSNGSNGSNADVLRP